MGNCLGKPDLGNGGNKKLQPPCSSRGVFNKDFLHLQAESLSTAASSAHFAAASPTQNTYSSIYKCSQDTILIGLIEGVESLEASNALTASFISNHLLQTFRETSQRYGGLDQDNEENILRSTLQSLHRQCLASPNLPRSKIGAVSATLALVNLTTHTCSVANVGHSRCLIAGISGSFNSKRPHCTWASTLHTTENQAEKIHADRHKSTSIPLFKRTKEGEQNATASQQPVFLTRALGVVNETTNGRNGEQWSAKKSFTSAIFKDKYDVRVDIHTFHLTQAEGHLIIGSSGFWELVSAPAVALRSHLFSKFQEAQKSVVEAALNNGVPLPSPAARTDSLAEHLIDFALATAADRLEASSKRNTQGGADYSSTTQINAEDLKNLPFELDHVASDELNGGTVTGDANKDALDGEGSDAGSTKNEEEEEEEPRVRKNVYGDLACVAISLQWPQQGHTSMFRSSAPPLLHSTAKARTGSMNTRGAGAMMPSQNSTSDLAPLARYRWLQLRLVVDYHRLHRREMLQRWHESVDGILKKAQQRAKAVAYRVENEYSIAVNVSPLMKLSAKDGKALPSSAFNVRASINF